MEEKNKKNKKIGIITFHNSYNCGSMMQTYALQTILEKKGYNPEIINYYTEGQTQIYKTFFKPDSIKNIIKNILLFPNSKKINNNNMKYEEFKNKNLKLSKEIKEYADLNDKEYSAVIAGSDQVWNITIEDYSKAYFLPWVENARKIGYAPSFGSKKIKDYVKNETEYQEFKDYLNNFNSISIRENNGQKWIKEMIGKEVPVFLDPTLLLDKEDYKNVESNDINEKGDYIFFYSPGFDRGICKFVKELSKKYNMPVITWSRKNYEIKQIWTFGFKTPEYENPAKYLSLIKNAKLVLTTSFHGAIFATTYRKKFYVLKNGAMFGNDDRVRTMLNTLKMNDRLIDYKIDENKDYLEEIDYTEYEKALKVEREKSIKYLLDAINGVDNI